MKEVVYTKQALLQFEESVKELVEQGYFGEEDYAVIYMRDIFRYFALYWILVCSTSSLSEAFNWRK